MITDNIKLAMKQLKKGGFIVLYDGDEREGEADLIFHASFTDPKKIELLRREAGGMIVLAIGSTIAKELNLSFLHEIFHSFGIKNVYVRTNYNDTPPYTIPVDHINAHTGVTDNDKTLALKDFADLASKNNKLELFNEKFRTPGHLPICVSKGIENRRGHTELSIELAKLAGLQETMVLCEMLDSGKALSKDKAIKYAKKHKLVFIKGKEI